MRVAHYVRVSTEEQKKGLSVDAQIEALKAFSEANGHTVVKIYNDAGISARKSYKKRPALLDMINDCQLGKIDLILICKLDRFFRSVPDYYAVMEQLNNVPWKAIHEDYSTDSADGLLKINLYLAIAQAEADKTSDRIKRTFEYKLNKGEYVGGNKCPIGYMRKDNKYVKNPEEEQAVNAFFNAYLSTLSLSNAIEAMAYYGKVINTNIASRILYHPAHYAALPFVEPEEAYITLEQHEIIEKAKRATKNYTTGYQYIFSGLLYCKECGGKMVANRTVRTRKDGSKKHTIRYVCKKHESRYGCAGTSINEMDLESYLIDNVDALIKRYNYSVKTDDLSKNDKQIEANKRRLARLKDLYEFGDICREEYIEKRDAITIEIKSLEVVSVEKDELPTNWKEIYNDLDIEHKRGFWNQIVSRIIITEMQCKIPIIIF